MKFKKIILSFIITLLLICFTGCSIHFRKDDSSNTVTNTNSQTTTSDSKTQETQSTTEQVVIPENATNDISDKINTMLSDEAYHNMTINQIDSKALSDQSGYKLNLTLVWNLDTDAEIAKSLAQKNANSMSNYISTELPYVIEANITFKLSKFNNAAAKISYKRNGNNLTLKKTSFDEKLK